MAMSTRQRLLEAGVPLLLQHGYNDLGIQELLKETGTAKGSFYHHFPSKEAFALDVIDLYMEEVHSELDACLDDQSRPPLDRVRRFFELTLDNYRDEGYLGCLLGGLGQELSGISEVFGERIEQCLSYISDRIGASLEEARQRGELPAHADTGHLADLLANCWEGAALRSRLRRSPEPLNEMLDFYFASVTNA